MAYGKRIERSRRLYSQKRESFVLRSGIVVLGTLLFLFLLIYLSRLEFFRIKEISIEGNSVTSSHEVESIIENNIKGFYFGMFSKKNFLIYPKNKIKGDIINDFQRIEEIDLSVRDFKELFISVKEREPDALWCGLKPLSEDEECYFIDSDGLIYSRAPNFSGNVFLRAYGSVSDGGPIGSKFLTTSKYQSLKFFKNSIEQYDINPMTIEKLPDGDMEIKFEEGGRLIYNSDQDMVRLSEDLGSILNDPEFEDQIKNGGLMIDYIDLRLGNKVYYKFK